jgi:hypothetical protein
MSFVSFSSGMCPSDSTVIFPNRPLFTELTETLQRFRQSNKQKRHHDRQIPQGKIEEPEKKGGMDNHVEEVTMKCIEGYQKEMEIFAYHKALQMYLRLSPSSINTSIRKRLEAC